MIIDGKKYLTVDETQDALGWSDLHTQKMLNNLKFPWVMIKRKRYVLEDDLKNIDGYLDRRSAEFSNQPKRSKV